MNCPFYGRHMYKNPSMKPDPPFLLLNQQGNECGLVTMTYSPCIMERDHLEVNWRECPLVRDVRMEL